MLHLITRLEGVDGGDDLRFGRDYNSIEDAISNAARAAGSLLVDDLSAGHRSIAFTLVLETKDGDRAAAIKLSATVTTDSPATNVTASSTSANRLFNM